jgi:hypothetical protein
VRQCPFLGERLILESDASSCLETQNLPQLMGWEECGGACAA